MRNDSWSIITRMWHMVLLTKRLQDYFPSCGIWNWNWRRAEKKWDVDFNQSVKSYIWDDSGAIYSTEPNLESVCRSLRHAFNEFLWLLCWWQCSCSYRMMTKWQLSLEMVFWVFIISYAVGTWELFQSRSPATGHNSFWGPTE